MSLKVDVQMQNPTLKRAFEPLLVRILPFFIHNPERLQKQKKHIDQHHNNTEMYVMMKQNQR